jgi:two-component system nitrate/nitrite response regulator NarL
VSRDPIRLAAVDDEAELLRVLVAPLTASSDVGEILIVRSVRELVALRPVIDAVLLDVDLRDGSLPAENVHALRSAGWPTLVYTSGAGRDVLVGCIEQGATGIVLKSAEAGELLAAVVEVAHGGTHLNREFARSVERSHALRLRESTQRVLHLLGGGVPLGVAISGEGVTEEAIRLEVASAMRVIQPLGLEKPDGPGFMIGAVDDHPVALLGIVEGLGAHLSDPWIHPVTSVDELLEAAIDFDVVILDVRLNDGRDPRKNVERLAARGWPVILFTSMTHADPREREAVAQCLVAGANAIVGKDDGVASLAEAIRAVRRGCRCRVNPDSENEGEPRSGRPDPNPD